MRQRSRFSKTLLLQLLALHVNLDDNDDDDGIGEVPSVVSIEPSPPPSLRTLQSDDDKPSTKI